ncbi:MAG: lytic transglycosylase domain-containing protein [Candidatus Woesearchaeota archaeon]
MKKIIKNKKAKFFIIIVVTGLIIAQVTMLFYIIREQKQFAGNIGLKAVLLFSSYQDAEETLFYVDTSAKLAAQEAFLRTARMGGFPEKPEDCQRYAGFAVWELDNDKCIPDADNTKNKNLQNAYGESLNNLLDEYFRLSPSLMIPTDKNYEISVVNIGDSSSPKTLVTGDAKLPLSLEIKKGVITPGVSYTTYNTAQDIKIRGSEEEKLKQIYLKYGEFIRKAIEEEGGASEIPGITESLIVALIMQESGGNPNARSYVGAVGLTQFMPGTAASYGLCSKGGGGKKPCEDYDYRTDPEESIKAAVKYLKYLAYKVYGGYKDNIRFALATYNGGLNKTKIKKVAEKISKNPEEVQWEDIIAAEGTLQQIPAETERYVERVMALKHKFEQLQITSQGDG